MPDKYQLLHRYWGFDTFRPLQAEIVDAVVQGHDVFVLLPTGGGKSLCYQLPALMREGICLVVSPLIALMKDQVQHLHNMHLKAACLVSGMSNTESTNVLYNAIAGEVKFLYVSPERLRQRLFVEHLRRMKVGLIAVDEAHCISQWGYDFRPPYLQIAEVRQYHPSTPLIALTATATPSVADDICQRLAMRNCLRFQSSFFRPNLTYSVRYGADKMPMLLELLSRQEGSGIVYVRNRRMTQNVADFLVANNIPAVSYHAGIETPERDRRQTLWTQGVYRVIVATNAFGMGIDKPDVRIVLHLEAPDSLEAYFQEAGRAGRDGLPSQAVLFSSSADDRLLEKNLETDFPTLKYIRNTYRALCNYYKLPLGSGAETQYDFDLADICHTYNFEPRCFYSACRFLEREGLVALPEQQETSSMLYIPMHREEIYRFQVEQRLLGDLLQLLIRLYPGVSTCPTPIDERTVASHSPLDRDEVTKKLIKMRDMHVVEYRPRTTKPQIVFTTARINENNLYLTDSSYRNLHEAAERRLRAMLDYVHNDHTCRSQQLLTYFGEVASPACGHCDVCRQGEAKTDTREAVLRLLDKTPMRTHDLCMQLELEGYRDAIDTVRQLLDEEIIAQDKNFCLSVL